jgi:bifunctional non-homologous end joining protein LigD
MPPPRLPIFAPMPLVQRREAFDDTRWIFELKYDGFRALAYVLGGKPRLVSRNGRDFKRFDDLRYELELEINADAAVLDGEICCLDESGRPLFFDLMRRRGRPVFVALDLLWLNGRDVRELTLTKRKTLLRAIVPQRSPCLSSTRITWSATDEPSSGQSASRPRGNRRETRARALRRLGADVGED